MRSGAVSGPSRRWYRRVRFPDRGPCLQMCTLGVGCILARKSTGFRRGGFQYGVFRISVRIPNFTMARMSPRESHFLVVDVVRWARNLRMFNSTHQDLTLHRECLSISDGKGWYQCPVGHQEKTSGIILRHGFFLTKINHFLTKHPNDGFF